MPYQGFYQRCPINITVCITIALVLFVVHENSASLEGDTVGAWAEEFGRELWDLGQSITKVSQIKSRYISLNAQVEKKNVKKLMKFVVENVSRMLSRKMDAIKCILNASEEAAENFEYDPLDANMTYYSSKYSPVKNGIRPILPESINDSAPMYREMSFNPDTNFYNIPINTSHSAVHVPTNVYDKRPAVQEAIQWSEVLDATFVQNYASDPALSWQYFGSSTGILRHYPAMQWNQASIDLFDCRKRSWFIEAATCSKDVIILLDISGSMRGYRNWISQLTVAGILDTLSNNDFVNILMYNDTIYELIPCFKDMLIQATFENIHFLKDAIRTFTPEGNANVTKALEAAFSRLEEYRVTRGCNETNVDCNQAIMLVTDGIPGNFTEVFDAHNRIENGTYIPVRVFTYLVGREVTKVREIQWMACLNRGYYVHIHELAEVGEQVLKYIPVIARPLVLQGVEHPVTWTHAYVDITSEEDSLQGDYRLLVSVTVPAFDRKMNQNNETRVAKLLGIAGTDIPLEDIDTLTLPYKLGVNAYAFVVSNNGYLLMHPDLRPMEEGILKENYNSIDLTEVEQIDDDLGPRKLGSKILLLREALVNDTAGSMLNIPVKFHFDNMRRVARQNMDFYYAPLHNTPFSLGLALPQGYGNMWIKVGDELKKNLHMGVDITQFFQGDNWKVHPEWVYCKYHYIEGHEYNNSEDELIHFLHKMKDLKNWKWSQQYEADPLLDDISWGPNGTLAESREFNCGRKTLADDDYYCNRELVQRLVFDAKVTDSFTDEKFTQRAGEELFQIYNVTLRFVATMSGLTRWQYVRTEDEDNSTREFGDFHSRAIDETWYKSAVLQHEIDSESFVFSVPMDAGNNDNILVTASHAIFPKDGSNEAPGSVVGFQFQHAEMMNRFMEITSRVKCRDCIAPCSAGEIDCYVLDSAGYIIMSEVQKDTGRFFGEIEGAVMETMLNLNIYQKITVYDFQALCFFKVLLSNDAMSIFNPLNQLRWLIQWAVGKLMWILMETNLYQLWDTNLVRASAIEDAQAAYAEEMCKKGPSAVKPTRKIKKLRKGQSQEEEDFFNRIVEPVCARKSKSCDKQMDLYILQQERLRKGEGYHGEVPTNCSRPFFINRIPNTNLLLVVVKSLYQTCYRMLKSAPEVIVYENGTEPPCHKLQLNHLYRRRLSGCYTEHAMEHEIQACGLASIQNIPPSLIFGGITILYLLKLSMNF